MNCPICCLTTEIYSNTSYFKKPVYLCKSCNLYISEDDQSVYQQEYWDDRTAVASIESGYTDENSIYRKVLLGSQLVYCKDFIKGKKVLEIGSGAGQMLYFMEQKGFDVTGIEPDARNVELINKKLKKGRCIAGYGEQVAITEQYDIIWLSHVFEHLQQPLELLEKLSKHCNDFIFIEVPNAENLITLKASIYDNPSSYHYTQKALTRLTKRTGLRISKCNCMRYMRINERRLYNRLGFMMRVKYRYYPYVSGRPEDSEAIRIILQRGK